MKTDKHTFDIETIDRTSRQEFSRFYGFAVEGPSGQDADSDDGPGLLGSIAGHPGNNAIGAAFGAGFTGGTVASGGNAGAGLVAGALNASASCIGCHGPGAGGAGK